MKDFIIAIAVLFVIFIPITYAQQYDSQSVNNHYNQYSPDNINNHYSQYESQYSPRNINNPYSEYGVQYSPKNVSNLPVQKEHDYRVGIVSGVIQGQGPKEVKESRDAALVSSFLGGTKPKKNILVFIY